MAQDALICMVEIPMGSRNKYEFDPELGAIRFDRFVSANSPANPYGIGTVYTRQQIDDALIAGTNLVTRDAVGHGTATAGIACGNGSHLWKYRGVACNATIIAVKIVAEDVPAHDNQPAESAFYDPSRIPIAISFVRDQARALGMPAVMLLNIGSSGGPMDGTSGLCQTLDAAVGPGIPGLVFVTGTSDDGGTPNHASGTVTRGGTADIGIHMGNPAPLVFDLWYSTNDQFDVTIDTPDGLFGPLPPRTSVPVSTARAPAISNITTTAATLLPTAPPAGNGKFT